MSINFYGHLDDGPFGERVHLCQSAVGWEMLLRARPQDGVTDIGSWMRSLESFELIRDQYGRVLDVDELLEWVENRLGQKQRGHATFRSGGAAFADYDFS